MGMKELVEELKARRRQLASGRDRGGGRLTPREARRQPRARVRGRPKRAFAVAML